MSAGLGALEGRRVLVVGASAGIGRAFAVRAVRAGAEVVLVARRAEALQAVVAEAGGGHAVAADICDEAGLAKRLTDVVAHLGHVDLVVQCAGAAPLRLLADSDAEDWRRTLEINVVAVNRLIHMLLPHVAPGGIVAVLTSEAAARPWTGMVHYAASKAAQETALKGWRLEHPEVRFAAVAVGPTQPTEFGDGFDPDLLERSFADWAHHGMLPETFMDTDDLAGVLIGTLAAALAHPGIGIEHLVLRSPSPAMGRKDIHGPR
jgi:NAD(P)-dependent dehydrogenase (short-subunit alcohol dehydrogenase family)